MKELPDLYRIRYDHILPEHAKRYVNNPKKIFKQDCIITEKIDGSSLGIGFKNGSPYLQGKHSHIPMNDKRYAYYGAWSWAWENIEKIEQLKGKLLYGEWSRIMHTCAYDNLPDWFIAFDCWDMINKKWMDYWQFRKLVDKLDFAHAPLLHEGKIKYNELPSLVENRRSTFSTSKKLSETRFSPEEQDRILNARSMGKPIKRFEDGIITMEGCVIKPKQNPKTETINKTTIWTNCAKLVVNGFLRELDADADWVTKNFRENKLAKWYD